MGLDDNETKDVIDAAKAAVQENANYAKAQADYQTKVATQKPTQTAMQKFAAQAGLPDPLATYTLDDIQGDYNDNQRTSAAQKLAARAASRRSTPRRRTTRRTSRSTQAGWSPSTRHCPATGILALVSRSLRRHRLRPQGSTSRIRTWIRCSARSSLPWDQAVCSLPRRRKLPSNVLPVVKHRGRKRWPRRRSARPRRPQWHGTSDGADVERQEGQGC